MTHVGTLVYASLLYARLYARRRWVDVVATLGPGRRVVRSSLQQKQFSLAIPLRYVNRVPACPARWCNGRVLDWRSWGRGFESWSGRYQAVTWMRQRTGKLSRYITNHPDHSAFHLSGVGKLNAVVPGWGYGWACRQRENKERRKEGRFNPQVCPSFNTMCHYWTSASIGLPAKQTIWNLLNGQEHKCDKRQATDRHRLC